MEQITVKTKQIVSEQVTLLSLDALKELGNTVALASALLFADFWKLGQQIVYRAYGSTDDHSAMFTEIVNALAPAMQDAMYRYLRRAGINASRPVVGSTKFVIGGVLDRGNQEAAMSYVRVYPPLALERKIVKAKVAKPLEGTAVERARTAAAKLIERTKTADPTGAAALNEMLQQHDSCVFDAGGNKILIDDDELGLIEQIINLRTDGQFFGFKTLDEVVALREYAKLTNPEVVVPALKAA